MLTNAYLFVKETTSESVVDVPEEPVKTMASEAEVVDLKDKKEENQL